MVRSIMQWATGACIAFLIAYTGYWYIQGLHEKIEGLETRLSEAVEALTDVRGAVLAQNTALKSWRASQERLEASQRETRDRIEYVLKTSKGNQRVVDNAVIDELCRDAGRKYCVKELRPSESTDTDNSNGTVQGKHS